ncbi:hypothetical protein K435DRAFT_180036 [Dendrothele bispora CBS 962.96]|uniref:Uncharacterized protein n=1 Tax=Dendrothele bispora (strain CBS 962.96) TaxID=1314807 RepID=A0A4S8LWX0_DENBC|nr:hypothetical protein K435DRAFT_180036 [Dendrothele bispora CBS 962.96]
MQPFSSLHEPLTAFALDHVHSVIIRPFQSNHRGGIVRVQDRVFDSNHSQTRSTSSRKLHSSLEHCLGD